MSVRGTAEFIERWQSALTAWDAAHSTERLWNKDAALWTASSEAHWLGWLDAPSVSRETLGELATRVQSAVVPGTTDILLCGMGGSSLAAEVITRVLAGDGKHTIHVLDSTEPSYVRAAFERIQWPQTMCVVASKSGTTLEPAILLAAAFAHARVWAGEGFAKRFVAITDKGSDLWKQASTQGFAAVIAGEPTIGGRFSALSPFGLVPAALHGIDLDAFLESARGMARACREEASANPGVRLGVFLGVAARDGRDKCTLILPRSLAPLGAWIEQLVAESTGKRGTAILPIADEPLASPDRYGGDRAFVFVRDSTGAEPAALAELTVAGHPAFEIDIGGANDLAGEFFRWEIATAVAGALLGVNPFNQPDVESAKVATRALTDAYERADMRSATPSAPDDITGLAPLLASVRPGDYVALLAFVPMTPEVDAVLQRARLRIRDATRAATMVGFGPRFLHSTGQAFKGGPNTGVFIQLTWEAPRDVAIAGRRVTFGAVIASQAAGDRQVLRERGRRVLHVHLSGDINQALEAFDAAVATALS